MHDCPGTNHLDLHTYAQSGLNTDGYTSHLQQLTQTISNIMRYQTDQSIVFG